MSPTNPFKPTLENLEPRLLLDAELLTNGGFEAGTLTGWNVTPVSAPFNIDSTATQAGSYDISYAGQTSGDQAIYQDNIALTAGVTYTLTGYYRVDAKSGVQGWRYAEFGIYPNSGPAWGNHLAYYEIDEKLIVGWTQATLQYTPSVNETVSVGFANWQTDATFGVDSISFIEPTVNTAPTAQNDSASVDEDGSVSDSVVATDPDTGDTLTYEVVTGPSNGTLSSFNTGTGAYTYDPSADYNGSDSFTFRASDGTAWSNTATISITVNPINDAPVAGDDSFTVDEDSSHSGTLSASDIDGSDTLTYEIVSNGSHGAATITNAATGAFTYDPSADYSGADSFTFRVSDGTAWSNTATISITVNPINDAPVAGDDSFSVDEDGSHNGSVSATDVDTGDTLTYILVSDVSNGSLTFNSDGTFSYSPTANYNGSDSFTFKANDGTVDSNTATVSITVNPINDAPVATGDSFSVDQNSTHSGTLTASDVDSGTLTYEIVTGASNGTATITNASTGAFTYDPDDTYSGADSFTFRVSDGSLWSNTATISVTVNEVVTGEMLTNGGFDDGSTTGWTVGAGTWTVNTTDPQGGTHDISHPGTTGQDEFIYQTNLSLNGGTTYTLTFQYRVDAASVNAETWRYAQVGFWPNSGPSWGAALASVQINDNTTTSGWVQQTVEYTPTANETVSIGVADWRTDATYGFDSFSLTGPGGAGNTAPTANDDTFSLAEDAANAASVGTVTATDPDTGDTLTYAITAGNASGIFAINSSTGEITVADNTNLDYESATQYVLTVNVSDGVASDDATITVNVTDVNDNAPVASNDTFSVAEDAANAASVGTVSATDADTVGTLTYAITAGNTDAIFGIDANTGEITVVDNTNLDYETTNQYVLTVNVSDGVASDDATITVNVTDVNDNAPVASNDTFSVAEDAANATAVGTVSATDADTVGTLTYAITAGNVSGIFAINSSTGEITVADNTNLDYESATQYVLTVNVSDGVQSDDATITVNVTDVNDNAPVASNDTFSVAEDAANATAVGAVSATDADTVGTLTYAITAGNASGIFAINSSTGEITVADNTNLDYESATQYVLTVNVSDGVASDDATITVNVTDVNDNAPVASNDTFSVAEDAANATAVGTVSATDADTVGTLTYAITGGNASGIFGINASTGEITVADNTNLDYESATQYVLTVNVSDGIASDDATITIDVTDVAEGGPNLLSDSTFDTALTSVTNTTTAPSAYPQDVWYTYDSLWAQNAGGYAEKISSTSGNIWQKIAMPAAGDYTLNFDYITASNTYIRIFKSGGVNWFAPNIYQTFGDLVQLADSGTLTPSGSWAAGSLSLTISAADAANPYLFIMVRQYSASGAQLDNVTLSAGGASNQIPVANADSFSVDEDGSHSGTLTATDGDSGPQPLTYEIVTAASNGTATITNASTGAFTYDPSADYNGSDSFTFRVSDGADYSNTATISITVNPINDAPVANADSFSVDEDGSHSGTLTASDVENDTLTYEIVTGASNGTATITNASTGAFTYDPNADYNGGDSFTFRVSDGAVWSNTATISVTVNSINDAPVATGDSFSVPQDSTHTGTLIASDVENDTLTYEIVTAASHGTATITNVTTGAFTYDPDNAYDGADSFTFRVSDGTAWSNTATMSVTVTLPNQAPTASNDSFSVNEDGSHNGTLTASDPDSGPAALTYEIVTGPANGSVSSLNTATGAFTYDPNADYNGSDSFTFRVFDGEDYSNTATMSITVTAVNDAPTATGGSFEVDQAFTHSGTLVGSDIDGTDTLTFEIVSNGSHGTATIDNATTGAFTYDPDDTYDGADSFTFRVSDGAAWSNTATMSVTVTGADTTWSVVFDGSTSSGTVTDSASLDISGTAITIEAWVRNQGPAQWDNMVIFRRNMTDYAGNNWTRQHGLFGSDIGRVNFGLVLDGIYYQTYTDSLPDDTWAHVAGVYDGSTMKIYIDGVESASVAASGNISTNNTNWLIGSDFQGKLDELRVSDSVRYTSNFTPAVGQFATDANTAMLVHFNEGSGASAADESGNSNNVSLSNVTWDGDSPVLDGSQVAPEGTADSYGATMNSTLNVAAPGVLGNDTDANGDPLTAILVSGPSHGFLTFNANGSFDYTPFADYVGADSFVYRAYDGQQESTDTTVTLDVINPDIYEWTQDFYGADKTSYTPQDPGASSGWSFEWAWNGPDSTPGTSDAHMYDAPRLGKVVTGGAHIYAPAGTSGLYAIRKSNGTQAWQFTTASVNATPAYHLDSDTLLVGGADGVLYKLDAADGSTLGAYDTTDAINLSVTMVDDYAYIVTDSGDLHKVDINTMTSPWASAYSAASAGHTPAAFSATADLLTFCTYDLNVHAVNNSDGSQAWKVKPTPNTPGQDADGQFIEFWGGTPVVAEQHGIVFVRMVVADAIVSGPGTGGMYPNTNAEIRQWLINNPEDQNLFALDLTDGSTSFIPAIGPGGTEMYEDGYGPMLRMQAMPVVKVHDNGDEVVYIQYRNGSSAPPDGRWDSHLGEMVLDDTTVSGLVAGDVRFVSWTNSQIDITDEQTPLTMAGDTIFNSHWGAAESIIITDRSDTLGSYSSPIQTTENNVIIRRQYQSGTADTATHWTTSGLSLYEDGRYWNGPGWWAYWNTMDPPGEHPTQMLWGAYSAGILPRYSIVADGMVIIEGNGGDLMIFDTALNSRPIVEYGSFTVNEDTNYSGTVSGSDLEGDSLTFSVVQQPEFGWVEMASDGSYTFIPTPDWNGTGYFTYKAYDGMSDSANDGHIDLTVNAVADNPVAEDGSARTIVDTAVDGQAVASDADPGDTLTYEVVSNPTNGSLTSFNTSTGAFTYTPGSSYTGTDSFTFRVSDGTTWSNTSTVNITVNTTTFANLLNDDGFESGTLGSWSESSATATVTSADSHSGSYSVLLSDGQIRQSIATTVGQDYKITAWIKFSGETGSDWGGLQVQAVDTSGTSWQTIGTTEYMRMGKYGSDWYEVGVNFTATDSTTLVQIGVNTGAGLSIDAYVDDIQAFAAPAVNSLPTISNVTVTPTSATSLPTTQNFSVTADDPDGAVKKVYWDFGDGDRAYSASGSRTLAVNGSYTGTVYVVDDNDEVTSATFIWSTSDASLPTVSLDATPSETSDSVITLTGSATGTGIGVKISTDDGKLIDATGTSTWSAEIDLHAGNNVLTVQVTDSNGNVSTLDHEIRYSPSGPVVVTDVWAESSSVERWKTLEINFDVANSAATNPQFPYSADPAPGMEWVDGCTVNAVFWLASDPSTTYTRPAFLFQDYDYQVIGGKDWFNPSGTPKWKVRFAPPEVGDWEYRIEVTEAKGSFTSGTFSFTANEVTDPDNHGPIVVSPTDSRYFEFADGTFFTGNGHGVSLHEPSDALTLFDDIGNGANQNLLRDWFAGDVWGSAWQGWVSRTLSGGGNTPPTGLSTESAFTDGLAALKLDSANPLMHNSSALYKPSLVAGETYTFRVRVRTEGVTGPSDPAYDYGLTVKLTGWPEVGGTYDDPAVVAHVKGDTPWHVVEGSFVATDEFLDSSLDERISIILENTTAGEAYVDSISLHQVLADGSLGENVLMDPDFNAYSQFDARESYARDVIFDAAEDRNIYFKLVIEEKEDWILQHYDPSGLPSLYSESFYAYPDTATYELHNFYWRYLMARWGSSQAIHSWEFVNEAAPGGTSNYRLTDDLAAMADADGNSRLVSTSTWSGLNEEYWTDPAYGDIDYADFHAYVEHTGWIEPWSELHDDSARFFHEYDVDARANLTGMPIVWGEMGIDYGAGSDFEEPLLANDTDGTWLHKITWARTGPGGVYPIYWYTDNIYDHNLHGIYGTWNSFIEDVPLTNGNYQDVSAASSDPDVRVMGQKDLVNYAAHMWIDNSTNTWGAAGTAQSSTITFNIGLASETFDVAWYDTSTGTVSNTTTVTSDGSGVISLSVSNLATDTAVKVARQLTVSNLTSDSGLTYNVVNDGFTTGATAYSDQSYTVSTMPTYLDGMTYIQTADADASSTTNGLSFDVNSSVTVYVAHDSRYEDKPDWLQDWTVTADTVTTSSGSTLTLYKKTFQAGTINLGANADADEPEDNDMFMVILDPVL